MLLGLERAFSRALVNGDVVVTWAIQGGEGGFSKEP